MSSDGQQMAQQPEVVRAEAGEQVLFEKATSDPPFEHLPGEAFGNLLVVTTGVTPKQVQRRLESLGHDPRAVGVVPITASEFRYDGPLWVSRRVEPSDLTGISIEVSRGFRYLSPQRGWLTFDSISTLLMYADESRVYRLLAWLVGNARENDVHGVYALARATLDDATYRRFLDLCDGVTAEEGWRDR